MKQKLIDALRPGRSYWAFIGIVLFFIIPEIAALLWGDRIKAYFHLLSQEAPDAFLAKTYQALEGLGEFSWLNFLLGVGLVVWFFYEKYSHRKR